MNWGKSITLVIIAFMTFILVLVFSFMSKTVDLEYEDYYVREVSYQDRIEAESNGLKYKQTIVLRVAGDAVSLTIPADFPKVEKGEVHFYRPDNAKSDIRMPFSNEKEQLFPLTLFKSGRYEMRLEWTSAGEEYFINKSLYIP